LKDDVTEDDKKRRHLEMKEVFKQVAGKLTETYVGQVHTVLVEGVSISTIKSFSCEDVLIFIIYTVV
jgi:tRNA A37 methylthiotransferase MiaB